MKKDNGKATLLMCIIVILILTLSLFALVLYKQINKNGEVMENSVDDNNVIIEPTQEENNITQNQVVLENNEDFEYSFLKMENNKKNMLYSPLSITYALKMLQEGSSGNTYIQINNLIGNKELPTYKNVDKNLSLANGIFIRDSFYNSVKEEYRNTLMNKYSAEVIKDAFSSSANINKWIENKTIGIIKKALDDSALNINTKAVLVNALAIDMKWKEEFETKDTCGKTFYLADGSEMKATTMNKETSSDNFSFYKENNVIALTMDLEEYEGQQLEFMAIMPDSNLSDYVKEFNEKTVKEIDDNLKKASSTKKGLDISIPKFKFDYNLALKKDLQNLGIKDAFDNNVADFSNMSNEKLFVSDAIHKANIEFSEKGIKAAAVTIFTTETNALYVEEKPIEIKIDKPFLFLIRDKKTKTNWFIGTVYEPNSWSNDKIKYISIGY